MFVSANLFELFEVSKLYAFEIQKN
jgi:hypothetical protein